MSDPKRRARVIKMPTTQSQILVLYGGTVEMLGHVLQAYAAELGSERVEELIALKLRLITSIKNREMAGLPLKEQARVVEILLDLLEASYPGIEVDGERIM